MLSVADEGTEESLENWCTYVLAGISRELKKVDKLTNKAFLNEKILFPAIQFSQQRQYITADEAKILRLACEQGEFKTGDLSPLFPKQTANQRTYQVKKLLDNHFILPIRENTRIYIPNFAQSYLIRGVIQALRENDFIGGLD
ncbi:hypothetical protein [Exercitatus varius]|nr:hypothetical protein [Exercitatus varius]MDG2942083.1 hypothetical protein [Exercitatus varius]